jgi:hypothetical protein
VKRRRRRRGKQQAPQPTAAEQQHSFESCKKGRKWRGNGMDIEEWTTYCLLADAAESTSKSATRK